MGEVIAAYGGIDVLCNIAGVGRSHHSHEVPKADWDLMIGVNLTGTFLMCRAALPSLIERKGAIINTAPSAGLIGQPYTAVLRAEGRRGPAGRRPWPWSTTTPACGSTPSPWHDRHGDHQRLQAPEGGNFKKLVSIIPVLGACAGGDRRVVRLHRLGRGPQHDRLDRPAGRGITA